MMAARATKAARLTPKQRTSFGYYPSYRFVDHDPILDQIDSLHEKAVNPSTGAPMKFGALSHASGVSMGTLHNWRKRKTKKPQFATVKAVVRALGGQLTIIYLGREIRPLRTVK